MIYSVLPKHRVEQVNDKPHRKFAIRSFLVRRTKNEQQRTGR
jgi:hypothetical protein